MSRGGARPGAGRKRREGRTNMTISVSIETLRKARELRAERVAVSEMIEAYIDALHNDVFLPFDNSK